MPIANDATTTLMQEVRIQEHRHREDSLAVWTGRKVESTVARVLRVRGKMMKNRAHGPSDCFVTEILQELPITGLIKDSEGDCRAPAAWKILRMVSLKKPYAKLENGIRGFRAIR